MLKEPVEGEIKAAWNLQGMAGKKGDKSPFGGGITGTSPPPKGPKFSSLTSELETDSLIPFGPRDVQK